MFLTKQDIIDAKNRLGQTIHHTGMYYSGTFSNFAGNKIYLKTENLQKTGSFKVRGAYNKIAKLSELQKLKTVVCASAGNHAQGVAYSATTKGIESIIVMPKGTPIAKVSATAGYGAKTVLYGDFYDDAHAHALKLAKDKKAEFIHPFDDLDIIAGQGTIALEMLSDNPDLDAIVVPVGGGGLLAGVAFMAKQIKPSIKVIGVQAEKADAFSQSFKAKSKIALNDIYTIADGIAVKNPGDVTLEYILKYADDILTVTDNEIAETVIHLMERAKLVVETAGATGVALAINKKLNMQNKNVACVLSGGNIDVGLIHKIVEKGLVSRGRQMTLSVVLPDKPGALQKFASIMGDNNANIISVRYDRTHSELNLNETILHIAFETSGQQHGEQVLSNLKKAGYQLQ